jgi:hypothetical protein
MGHSTKSSHGSVEFVQIQPTRNPPLLSLQCSQVRTRVTFKHVHNLAHLQLNFDCASESGESEGGRGMSVVGRILTISTLPCGGFFQWRILPTGSKSLSCGGVEIIALHGPTKSSTRQQNPPHRSVEFVQIQPIRDPPPAFSSIFPGQSNFRGWLDWWRVAPYTPSLAFGHPQHNHSFMHAGLVSGSFTVSGEF